MTSLENVHDAWGGVAPDWVIVLAKECHRTSQNQAGRRIGYTASAVNQVLHNNYRAGTVSIEHVVRRVLISNCLDCPQLGAISESVCKVWRERAKAGLRVNRLHVQMSRACSRCPMFAEVEEVAQAISIDEVDHHN